MPGAFLIIRSRVPCVVSVAAALALATSACVIKDAKTSGSAAAARVAAEAFLDRYVDETGRVVRHDQGGDTVSEGQAYGLLLAVALRDRARFDLVWSWTRDNIQRPDQLSSWHWDSGVTDQNPAADADLDVAPALVLAGRAFDDDALVREGTGVGRQILEKETMVYDGKRVLLPGPWAERRHR